MRRGTTPTITFNLPFAASTIEYCEVYFAQNDELLVEKTMADCVLSDNVVQVTLTQEETLRFDEDEKLEVQMRFGFADGSVEATDIIKGKVKKILDDSEMEW